MSLDELFPEATSKGNIQNPEEWLILEENFITMKTICRMA